MLVKLNSKYNIPRPKKSDWNSKDVIEIHQTSQKTNVSSHDNYGRPIRFTHKTIIEEEKEHT